MNSQPNSRQRKAQKHLETEFGITSPQPPISRQFKSQDDQPQCTTGRVDEKIDSEPIVQKVTSTSQNDPKTVFGEKKDSLRESIADTSTISEIVMALALGFCFIIGSGYLIVRKRNAPNLQPSLDTQEKQEIEEKKKRDEKKKEEKVEKEENNKPNTLRHGTLPNRAAVKNQNENIQKKATPNTPTIAEDRKEEKFRNDIMRENKIQPNNNNNNQLNKSHNKKQNNSNTNNSKKTGNKNNNIKNNSINSKIISVDETNNSAHINTIQTNVIPANAKIISLDETNNNKIHTNVIHANTSEIISLDEFNSNAVHNNANQTNTIQANTVNTNSEIIRRDETNSNAVHNNATQTNTIQANNEITSLDEIKNNIIHTNVVHTNSEIIKRDENKIIATNVVHINTIQPIAERISLETNNTAVHNNKDEISLVDSATEIREDEKKNKQIINECDINDEMIPANAIAERLSQQPILKDSIIHEELNIESLENSSDNNDDDNNNEDDNNDDDDDNNDDDDDYNDDDNNNNNNILSLSGPHSLSLSSKLSRSSSYTDISLIDLRDSTDIDLKIVKHQVQIFREIKEMENTDDKIRKRHEKSERKKEKQLKEEKTKEEKAIMEQYDKLYQFALSVFIISAAIGYYLTNFDLAWWWNLMAINKKPEKIEASGYFDFLSMDKLFAVSMMPYLDFSVKIVTGLVCLLSTLALSKLVTKSVAMSMTMLIYVYFYYRFIWITLFRLVVGSFMNHFVFLILPKRADNIVMNAFVMIFVSSAFGYMLAISDPLMTGKEIASGFQLFDSLLPLTSIHNLWLKIRSLVPS